MSLQNPQLEDGYTPVANTIMEPICYTRLSGTDWDVLHFLWRKTYGWSKKSDVLSLSQFAEGTGLSRSHVCRTITRLVKMNVIFRTVIAKTGNAPKAIAKTGNAGIATYEFNKRIGTWKPLPELATLQKTSESPLPILATTITREKRHTRLKKKRIVAIANSGNALDGTLDGTLISGNDELPPDLPEPRKPSEPYELALWFYESRGIPAKPTAADMRNFKMLLQFYDKDVIKKGIMWRLEHDPEGFWSTHISSASVYRNFGNWMAESTRKAEKFSAWLDKNPTLDYRKATDLMARADGFMRAFNEAKKNPLVYFDDEDYSLYRKSIRIKTREAHEEVKNGR